MVTGVRGAGQPLAEGEDAHFRCAKIMTARFYTDDILVKAPVRRDGIVEGAAVVRNSHRRRSHAVAVSVAVRAPPRDRRAVRRLEQLGYQVSLSPAVSIAT
jgi:hypothetical protein